MKAHWPIQGCAIFPTNPNFEQQTVFVEPTNCSDNIEEVFFRMMSLKMPHMPVHCQHRPRTFMLLLFLTYWHKC